MGAAELQRPSIWLKSRVLGLLTEPPTASVSILAKAGWMGLPVGSVLWHYLVQVIGAGIHPLPEDVPLLPTEQAPER